MFQKNSKSYREAVKAIFRYTDIKFTRDAKNEFMDKFSNNKRFEKASNILDDGFEDAFQYTIVAKEPSRLKSANVIERLNQEVCR